MDNGEFVVDGLKDGPPDSGQGVGGELAIPGFLVADSGPNQAQAAFLKQVLVLAFSSGCVGGGDVIADMHADQVDVLVYEVLLFGGQLGQELVEVINFVRIWCGTGISPVNFIFRVDRQILVLSLLGHVAGLKHDNCPSLTGTSPKSLYLTYTK